ncbi:PhzF family phenazine biosynthesis isomerase [Rudanella paleaurantiibacter]|uniref:PhzF family phenazine biosynthesis isomerase n=1 Tax=Rudanella paleaurantiibacter TaxID=2614655 RepID=A0A7J5TS16_9BACT|nr:PhzF family phenazine biosynthesis protein [Rudanella paleaurantiibacter]KAB7725608.1 PhzF family phenazine biosynthesis isomerase [Rudanella paleaurantiibacter]
MRLYQLDAFTDRLFAGNPAAVCPLTEWLPDETMQQIAAENNLAETAFYTHNPATGRYHIRWFTPTVEVDLCGHATLATAHVIFSLEPFAGNTDKIYLDSRSGELNVCRQGDWLVLDFPADTIQRANVQPPALLSGLEQRPLEIYKGKSDYLLVYGSQAEIESLNPNFRELASVPARGVIVTAPGDGSPGESGVDFVSRFFAPQSGVDEDPVTGSAHTTLIPYWAERLGKTELTARQISRRGGYLRCKHNGERVDIAGQVKLYMTADIHVG